MKHFFYKHPLLTRALIEYLNFLPIPLCTIVGIFIPGGLLDDGTAVCLAACVVGLILSGLLVVFSPLKVLSTTLAELEGLMMGRKCFHTEQDETRSEAESRIQRNLEKAKMKPVVGLNDFPDRLGLWHRLIAADQKQIRIESVTHTSNNYILYSVSHLDAGKWEAIYRDLCECMAERRAFMRERGKTEVIYAVCVLADHVDPDISEKMRSPQSFALNETVTVRGVRVCVAEVSKNRWYASAEIAERIQVRSNASRKMLGEMTFGRSGKAFPYKGNTEYTDAYFKFFDEICDMTLGEISRKVKEKEEKENELPSDKIYATMQDGDIRREGDILYCLIGKKEVDVCLYLPEEAEKELLPEDEEDQEDEEDFEDLTADEDADDEQPEKNTIPPDYRGEIVATVPKVSFKPRIVTLNRPTQKAICSNVKSYLLAQGFAHVSFLDYEKSKIIKDLPEGTK